MIKINETAVFNGFTTNEVNEALDFFYGIIKKYKKGQMIYSEGDTVMQFGIVLSGSITIEKIDYIGNKNIIGYNREGHIFAESYAMTGRPLMVDVVANEESEILFLNIQRLIEKKENDVIWIQKFLLNMLLISNHKNLQLSCRNFHTSSKHVRGRVTSYLNDVSNDKKEKEFDIPFDRQQMANYLNLDRSSLSNELSKMRDEGMIEFNKNHFKIMW